MASGAAPPCGTPSRGAAGRPEWYDRPPGPDGATLQARETVRAVGNSAIGAQPAADGMNGNPDHAPQHPGGLTGHQSVRPVRGDDLCPGSPAHDDREPVTLWTDRDDRWPRFPLMVTAPSLIALDQVLDRVGEAAAVSPALAGLGQRVQELLNQAPLIDGAEQDQVPLAREHPVTGYRPQSLPVNALVHPDSPTRGRLGRDRFLSRHSTPRRITRGPFDQWRKQDDREHQREEHLSQSHRSFPV